MPVLKRPEATSLGVVKARIPLRRRPAVRHGRRFPRIHLRHVLMLSQHSPAQILPHRFRAPFDLRMQIRIRPVIATISATLAARLSARRILPADPAALDLSARGHR